MKCYYYRLLYSFTVLQDLMMVPWQWQIQIVTVVAHIKSQEVTLSQIRMCRVRAGCHCVTDVTFFSGFTLKPISLE